MDKYTFVNELNACLKGKIDQRELDDTMKYYRDYIDMEIRKGKSEAEVLEMLGSPRLLAKTIISTKGNEDRTDYVEYRDYDNSSYEERFGEGKDMKQKVFRMPLWLGTLLFFLVVVLVFSLLFKVVTILAPVILIFMAIGLVMKLIKDMR